MIRRLWKFTLLSLIILIVMLIIAYILYKNVVFSLNGEEVIELELNSKYIDNGVRAKVFRWDISKNVDVNSNLNMEVVGSYEYNYKLSFLGREYYLKRTINVIDNIPPVIELKGSKEIKLYVFDSYIEQGAIAYDNYDNDLTEQIKIESNLDLSRTGNYKITYYVKDSYNNESSVEREIVVEKKKVIKKELNNYNQNDPIIKYIKDNNYNVSIGYYNLVTGRQYLYQENKVYDGASLIKTLDAIYLYDKSMVNDVVKPYISNAIQVSDNESHYYLVDYIGRDNLRNYGISLGAYNTFKNEGYFSNTTVKDQIVYLKKLYSVSQSNEEIRSYFINDYGNFLKINDIDVMHKYGYNGRYYHDVGIVLDSEPYIVVVLTMHGTDNKKQIINNIANFIYKYHKGKL